MVTTKYVVQFILKDTNSSILLRRKRKGIRERKVRASGKRAAPASGPGPAFAAT